MEIRSVRRSGRNVMNDELVADMYFVSIHWHPV